MKKKDIVKVFSQNGEIHFVLREQTTDYESKECICPEDVEVVTVMKREALKPLLLLREE